MDWMKFRPLYFLISSVALVFSLWAVLNWGFKLSIDFTGGSIVDLRWRVQAPDQVGKKAEEKGFKILSSTVVDRQTLRLHFAPDFSQKETDSLANTLAEDSRKPSVLRFETVGPKVSAEIIKKTYVALALGTLIVLLWIAWRFKSVEFGFFAILALVHDLMVVLGTFSLLGFIKGVEIDILFVTALLTVLSLSIYDTIVVYDRVRESSSALPHVPFFAIANKAITETIVRSLNTSLTTSFVLFALFLFGGESIKWFVLALLVGIISGTYSSLFVAVPLLVSWSQVWGWWRGRQTRST